MAEKNVDSPDWVQEAETEIKREAQAQNPPAGKSPGQEKTETPTAGEKKEIAIKFGKGLVGAPFTTKSGKQMVKVKIPNTDPKDRTPWASFVISPTMIHDNRFGKGVWMKLPENGKTRVKKSVCVGADPESGKKIWEDHFREVPNPELKAMMEAYKTRGQEKESVLGAIKEKKEEAPAEPKPEKTAKPKDQGIAKQRFQKEP